MKLSSVQLLKIIVLSLEYNTKFGWNDKDNRFIKVVLSLVMTDIAHINVEISIPRRTNIILPLVMGLHSSS